MRVVFFATARVDFRDAFTFTARFVARCGVRFVFACALDARLRPAATVVFARFAVCLRPRPVTFFVPPEVRFRPVAAERVAFADRA